MSRFRISLSIGVAAFSLILAAAPAKALNALSYVSFWTGSDSNSCLTPAAACNNITAALTKTEPGGEIKCLDNHRDEILTIEKPITIDCDAPSTLILGFAGQAAVTVNLNEATYPNGVVTLRNLNFNGFLGNGAFAPGTDGIRVLGGGAAVHIENVTIQGFALQGIGFAPSSSVDLFVRDTVISNSQGVGILVKPSGASSAKVVLDNVNVEGNANGITIDGRTTSGSIKAALRDSSIGGHGAFGVYGVDSGSGATNVTVEESTSANNTTFGIGSSGVNSTVRVRNSTVTGNGTGLQIASSGKIISLGGNSVRGNTSNGAFTATEAQQ